MKDILKIIKYRTFFVSLSGERLHQILGIHRVLLFVRDLIAEPHGVTKQGYGAVFVLLGDEEKSEINARDVVDLWQKPDLNMSTFRIVGRNYLTWSMRNGDARISGKFHRHDY